MIAPSQMQQQQTPQSLAQAPVPQMDQERKRVMREAFKAFRGEFPDPLVVKKGQPNDNVKPNVSEPIVTKGASWLFGPVLGIEATGETADNQDEAEGVQSAAPPAPKMDANGQPIPPKKAKKAKPSPAQDYLDGFWGDDDDKMTLFAEMAMNGGVCGQVFVKLIPPKFGMKYPRLVVLDPQNVRIVSHPEDCKLHLAYVIEYPMSGNWEKRQIVARIDPGNTVEAVGDEDVNDTWTITTYIRSTISTAATQQNSWIQTGPTEDWPYPFAPIFTCSNLPNPNEHWGTPDLTHDLIAQNKTLNFLFSNLARIIKYHGHPKTFATGVNAAQISTAVDDILCLPSENSKLEALAPMENFGGILSVIAAVMSNIDEQSRVPGVALGRITDLPKGNISGVALALLFQPLMEKTTQKQRLYGKMIREICRAVLILAGILDVSQYEDYKIGLKWQNLLPIDNLAAAQTAQILSALGVSKATLMAELGYNADEEADKNAEEDAQALTRFSQGRGFPPAPSTPPAQQPAPGQPQTAQSNAQQAVGA